MNDLISRQAAIDVADAVWSATGDKNVAKVWDQIKDLPSAQQWIPVSERMLEAGLVLVKYADGDVDILEQPTPYKQHDIIAWMPIPEYQAPDRDCEHCVHRKDKGCERWDCEFERRTRPEEIQKYTATETTKPYKLNFCPECGRAIKHRYKNPEETKAVMSFYAYYEIAKANSWIEDRVAWALHQAWKDAEKERLKRKEKNDAERN